MNSVEQALKAPASELISAASSPATTSPRTPTGSTCCTISGNAAWAWEFTSWPFASSRLCCRAGIFPVTASATASIPGMMKMKTGSSLSSEAKMAPRRASLSFGAPSVRCTMYWSVHQYHRPMIGAQNSIPSHG